MISKGTISILQKLHNLYLDEGVNVVTMYRQSYKGIAKFLPLRTSKTYGFTQAHLSVSGDYSSKHPSFLTGYGISYIEVIFLGELARSLTSAVRNILVIGNAWGYSTLALSLAFPSAKIVAIDSCPGTSLERLKGINLTNSIAARNLLNCVAVEATSPVDLPRVSHDLLDGPLDIVFIDGSHDYESVVSDFEGSLNLASSDCVFLFHDVVLHKLEKAFYVAGGFLNSYKSVILRGTPSGIGILYPEKEDLHSVLSLFGAHINKSLLQTRHSFWYKLGRKLSLRQVRQRIN
jgi:hypothetical protein